MSTPENKPPVFILTEDTGSIKNLLLRPTGNSPSDETSQYLQATQNVLQNGYSAISPEIAVKTFREAEMESALTCAATSFLQQNPQAICVCLDRFLLTTIENDQTLKARFSRLQICRSVDGARVPRQLSPPLASQVERLKEKYPDIADQKILIVDDGVFSGGTINSVLELLSKISVSANQVKVLGFIGDNAQKQLQEKGVETEIANEVPNLFDWVDLRDFGVFGGKLLAKSKSNRLTSAIPYLSPWSDGSGASLNQSGSLFTASQEIIGNQITLLKRWEEQTGRPLTFADAIRSGFPLPTDKNKTIPVSAKQRIVDYLETCQGVIKTEQNRQVVVFDMDGTLYQLAGSQNGGYTGSVLESRVLENALRFITDRENCSEDKAKEIRQQGLADPVGLSAFLANRYKIKREQYFDSVWDINPDGVIQNFEPAKTAVQKLQKTDVKLVLLTSAPKIWQKRVTEYLDLQDAFETTFTGENFGAKTDVFKLLSQRYLPQNIVSIGDQEKTDIKPAIEFGIRGVLVKNPRDLINLSPFINL